MNQHNSLNKRMQEISENGYQLKIGTYFSEGWQLFMTNMWIVIAFCLIAGLANFILQMIPIIGSFIPYFMLPIILLCYYIGFRHIHKNRNQQMDFAVFFDGLKNRRALDAAFFGAFRLLTMIPFIFVVFGIYGIVLKYFLELNPAAYEEMIIGIQSTYGLKQVFEYLEEIGGILFGIGCILLIPSLIFNVLISQTPHFIAFFDMNVIEAMKHSSRLVKKKWWSFLWYLILNGLAMVLGVIPCLIGLLWTIPWTRGASFALFNDLVLQHLNEDEDSAPDLLQHFRSDI